MSYTHFSPPRSAPLPHSYWHLAHWALWGNPELLARSDAFFFDLLPNATAFATQEGYHGAHWPKETAAVANRSAGGFGVPWLGLDHAAWPFGGVANGSILTWESPQVCVRVSVGYSRSIRAVRNGAGVPRVVVVPTSSVPGLISLPPSHEAPSPPPPLVLLVSSDMPSR